MTPRLAPLNGEPLSTDALERLVADIAARPEVWAP
ncbi:MAG: hypothetical protein QOF76_932, partial [Solirubrobacteraceae bacterium]|nr:hypothetical protein [Solirubrobacteraceae bacterium]